MTHTYHHYHDFSKKGSISQKSANGDELAIQFIRGSMSTARQGRALEGGYTHNEVVKTRITSRFTVMFG